jgi:histidine triad (HIT) family protein
MKDCIFCQMVRKEMPCHMLWEDEKYMAFLSIFPNTEGVSVVIPKEHVGSYVFDAPDSIVEGLMRAARKVARGIDGALDDVGRTGMVFEGFGVDHLHAKLFPMHQTADMKEWKPIESPRKEFYEAYPGFLSSHDAERKNDAELEKTAQRIRTYLNEHNHN